MSSRSHLINLSPLTQSPAFARLWAGSAIAGIGSQMTIVAVGLHIYELTASTFAVAMVGAVALLPMIVAGLYGGMLADVFDRRLVALIAAVVAWLSTVGIAAIAWTGVTEVLPFYVLTAINSVAATIIGATRMAIVPRLLPASLIPAASALNGINTGIMITVGPALAGVLVATVGFGWTYTIDVILFSAAFLGIVTLPPIKPEGEVHRPGLESLRQGVQFLRRAPNIRMSFLVDIIAMTFGRPHALFPAVGMLAIGGGAITVGVLTAAGAIGAMLSSLLSGRIVGIRRHGVAIGWSIAVYGLFILGFGLTIAIAQLGGFPPVGETIEQANMGALVVAAVMMAGTGASDNISAIFRMTMLQTAVPDNMRGRLQGVFQVVVTGGPRVGDFYIGVIALFSALWFAPVLGGVLIITLIALCMRLQSSFRHYDALNPTP